MSVPLREKGHVKSGQLWWGRLDEDEENPELVWPRSVHVYDQMRRQDSQVISVLRAVMLPIRRTAWRIDGTGCRPEVAQHVADDLGLDLVGDTEPNRPRRTRDRFSWPDHLRLALLMLPFGHSFFEQVYRLDPTSGLYRIRKLGWRPPRTITDIKVADDGGLEWIEQAGAAGAPVQIPVDRLVAYVNEREGGNWLGQSLLRPAYKDWRLKDRKLRTQAQMIDRNGLGTPYYETSDQTRGGKLLDDEKITAREKAEMEAGQEIAASARAGDESGVSYPNGAKFGYKGVEGTLPDIVQPIRYHDEQIARAVLAHFLNLGTETGSWALGSTFADFFTLSLQTVAMTVQDVTNQHVIEDLVDANWGTEEPAPRLVFDEIGSRHPATAEAIADLIDCGAIRPDEKLEQHVRTVHGLPAADPDSRRDPQPRPAGTPSATDRARARTAQPAERQEAS